MADGKPTLEEVRTYLDLPVGALSDADLSRIWTAVQVQQVEACFPVVDVDGVAIPDEGWPAALVQALLRRVQRNVATRNLPLGYASPDATLGPLRLLNYDAVIEELEGPWRKVVFA